MIRVLLNTDMSPVRLCIRSTIPFVMVVTVLACGSSPTTPSPTATVPVVTSAPPGQPPVRQPLQILGRVLDSADHPVIGAKLTQWDTANTAISDANGYFDLTAKVTAQDRTFWLTVEKAGF